MEIPATESAPSAGRARLGIITVPGAMGRIGRLLRRMVIGILDELIEVTLVAPDGEEVSSLPVPPARLLRYPTGRNGRLRRKACSHIAEKLAEGRIELLQGLEGPSHELTRKISDLGRWPYVLWRLEWLSRCPLEPVGGLCRAVLAGSETIAADLVAGIPAIEPLVRILRPGVHLAEPGGRTRADRSRAILVAGDLDVEEPFVVVLEALAELRRCGYECVFFLLGTGKAEGGLRRRARALGLTHHLTFVPHLDPDQLVGVAGAADALVYPRTAGAVEMDILAAMAAGVPVLTGGPCVGDFVLDGQTALRYRPDQWADLAVKLKVLLDEPETGAGLVQAAFAHLREHHSPAGMVAAAVAIYREHALRGRTLKLSAGS